MLSSKRTGEFPLPWCGRVQTSAVKRTAVTCRPQHREGDMKPEGERWAVRPSGATGSTASAVGALVTTSVLDSRLRGNDGSLVTLPLTICGPTRTSGWPQTDCLGSAERGTITQSFPRRRESRGPPPWVAASQRTQACVKGPLCGVAPNPTPSSGYPQTGSREHRAAGRSVF